MFYIEHGSTKEVDDKQLQFNARQYQWLAVPSELEEYKQFSMKFSVSDKEWEENGCHPNGNFKCPRCYRKHYITTNFDFLCDGCVFLLLDYFPDHDASIAINDWNTKDNSVIIEERNNLRNRFDNILKAKFLSYDNKTVIIIKELLKNNDKISVCFEEDLNKKNSNFEISVFELIIEN